MPLKKTQSVLFVASECFPLIKTGGLADVVGALPIALAHAGTNVTVFLPGFPKVLAGIESARTLAKIKTSDGPPAKLISGTTASGLNIIALDAPQYFDIEGNPYLDDTGNDRPDNGAKYAYFSKVAADVALGKIGRKKYDILHAHDWQAGLCAAYVKASGTTKLRTILTIHNLAFQGRFPKFLMASLGLPTSYYSRNGLEYWDQVSFLKAGIMYSDHITTVSPTYALEIQSDDGGMGFGGLLRARSQSISGLLNGIDLDVWNPETDPEIYKSYSAENPKGKAGNKSALQKALKLRPDAKAPLFTVISRLTTQKGLDLLADMTDFIVAEGGQIALLGSGDSAIEDAFNAAAKKHPTEISVTIGYDEPLAHQLQAGADAIFIPSRFEPCGLTQLCAMRYGTVPIVGRVGGLNDTVIDASPMALANGAATGVQFAPVNAHMLYSAISRAFDLYSNPAQWNQIVTNCLNQNVGWETSAADYRDLYASL
ncbi:MAG: glycogen synthase GlgA [Hellea sp.]|nr:glycogen synthase GlgA [Hellea sp.]